MHASACAPPDTARARGPVHASTLVMHATFATPVHKLRHVRWQEGTSASTRWQVSTVARGRLQAAPLQI